MSTDSSHACATAIAKAFFADVKDRNLDAGDTLVALESFLTIAVIYVGTSIGQPDIRRYAQEILDTMTDRAMGRMNDYLENGATK
ncbi:MAG TPA: hypothetical protein VMP68_31610 [Candidatus Eisenbacteria bacterium]|nr:hypothetical protein [Candidatus Eisenbacteria bacterium]